MAGVPVFTSSPINAAQASGLTPQTATQPDTTATNQTPTTTKAAATTSSEYIPARPGAAAVPEPTGTVRKYVPSQPTPTRTLGEHDPPAPQPGPFPKPSNIRPPPKAGEPSQPQSISTPSLPFSPPQPYPPQMTLPPPTPSAGSQVPVSSTSISTSPSSTYPAPIPVSNDPTTRRSLEHPPGYQQNTGASEPVSESQRVQDFGKTNMTSGGQDSSLGGLSTEGMWDTAKKWAQSAGEKVTEAEAEVWRRINKS